MKQCCVCKERKSLSEFYKNKLSKGGHRNDCKTCCLKHNREYRQTEKGKIAFKRYRQSKKGKATRKQYLQSKTAKIARKAYKIFYSQEIKARNAVNHAIRAGKLPRPDTLQCYYCLEKANQYHHHKGYTFKRQLDIVPACQKCHTLRAL